MPKRNVITIGFAKHALVEGSREHARMCAYAEKLDSLSIVVFTRKGDGFTEPLRVGGLTVYPTNTRTRLGALIRAFRIVRMILTKNSSISYVISTQDPRVIGWMSWILSRAKNARLHVQVHGDYFDSAWAGHSVVRHVERACALLLLRHTPHIRVVSERIKKSLVIRGIEESKITVLPIRPELEHFLSTNLVPHKGCVFVYVGRLAPEKNVARIIRAFAKVYPRIPDTRLRIVGEGVCEYQLRTLVEALGLANAVDFVPWTNYVADEMARADVFVLGSKHEAYGLVLLEAIAVGLPVITTDVGCVGEVIVDGVHGLVVRGQDDQLYADAVYRMGTDIAFRKMCSENARNTAQAISAISFDAYVESWVSALD